MTSRVWRCNAEKIQHSTAAQPLSLRRLFFGSLTMRSIWFITITSTEATKRKFILPWTRGARALKEGFNMYLTFAHSRYSAWQYSKHKQAEFQPSYLLHLRRAHICSLSANRPHPDLHAGAMVNPNSTTATIGDF